MLRKLRNWFTNTQTREAKHAHEMFEVEKEHAYLNTAILQVWDYVAILETDIARRLLKLNPEDFNKKRRKFVEEVSEEKQEDVAQTWNGMRVFGGKNGPR